MSSSSAPTSRLPKPTSSRSSTPTNSQRLYSSPRLSSSRSQLPQPKVLPFPDLPVRPQSQSNSRATSPTSRPSRYPISRESSSLTIDRIVSDGEARPFTSSSISPPVSSPLMASASSSRYAQLALASSSRSPSMNPPMPITISAASSSVQLTVASPLQSPISPPISSTSPSAVIGPVTSFQPRPQPPSTPPPPKLIPPTPVKKLSTSSAIHLPASQRITPISDTEPLSSHLYQSFLKSTCADVRLYVKTWGVSWKLHRMVLSQAGFFHSLFLGGFSETRSGKIGSSLRKGKGKAIYTGDEQDDWDGEDVELVFDDPNVTRAAFEICLSRMYSSFPHLHFPTSLLPTPQYPLTPSYPPVSSLPSLRKTHESLSSPNYLATPRLLLSLLATTIYLGQSLLMREVLAMVLRTVGPCTVGRYLGFAVGDGIGEEEWDGQNEEAARGLENVGKAWRDPDEEHSFSFNRLERHRNSSVSDPMAPDEPQMRLEHPDVSTATSRQTARTTLNAASLSIDNNESSYFAMNLPHFYGFASDKLGEACVCFLSRWGIDILTIETNHPEIDVRIWGHDGLPSRFVRALLSSDGLFVAGEMERYKSARKVMDLRRKGWEEEAEVDEDEWEEDERELEGVFADGIYYTHMTFADLSSISSDIDPNTSLPYAPLHVLQSAHWSAADLRSRILSSSASDSAELGLTQSSSDISSLVKRRRKPTSRSRVTSPTLSDLSTISSLPSFSSFTSTPGHSLAATTYHPVPSDDTHRIGAGGLLFLSQPSNSSLLGIPGIPDLGPEPPSTTDGKKSASRSPPHGEKTFFGILSNKRKGAEIEETFRPEAGSGDWIQDMGSLGLSQTQVKEERWSRLEPFRFSVEFWGVESLVEKERVYSSTHFYAGSFFNVYVQTIKRKEKNTMQLGIYLHRQSTSEPFPQPSLPPSHTNPSTSSSTDTLLPPILSRSFSHSPTTVSIGSPPNPPSTLVASSAPSSTSDDGGYRDPRPVTKAYFSISCASALGTALIRFSSAPDSFTLSQSWGWKSSALRTEEYLSSDAGLEKETLEEGVMGWTGEIDEGRLKQSLRATVVVGII
ncbi:hypothetical protein P7C73_g6536, partial [Tremellales sp. Uapishka_1]